MSDPREKTQAEREKLVRETSAKIVRDVATHASVDELDQFMSQYARAAVIEWLFDQMPMEARVMFLQTLTAKYAGELAVAAIEAAPPS